MLPDMRGRSRRPGEAGDSGRLLEECQLCEVRFPSGNKEGHGTVEYG